MAWNDRDRIRLEPKTKTDYWFSKYNRVLLHYSVSINAVAATAAYIRLSAASVHILQSVAAAAYAPRSAAFMLFSRNTTMRTSTWLKTPLEYYTTPRTIKITPQGESPAFGPMTSLPLMSLSVTSHPVAMLLSVMSYGTFCTTTIVRKKAQGCTSGHAQNILTVMMSLPVTWLHVTSFPVRASSLDITSSNACVMAGSPLLPPKYALSYPDILHWYLDLGGSYAYAMKNYRRTAKFFATWELGQKYCPSL
jgi:hypothetical protein